MFFFVRGKNFQLKHKMVWYVWWKIYNGECQTGWPNNISTLTGWSRFNHLNSHKRHLGTNKIILFSIFWFTQYINEMKKIYQIIKRKQLVTGWLPGAKVSVHHTGCHVSLFCFVSFILPSTFTCHSWRNLSILLVYLLTQHYRMSISWGNIEIFSFLSVLANGDWMNFFGKMIYKCNHVIYAGTSWCRLKKIINNDNSKNNFETLSMKI